VLPAESARYWGGLFLDSHRIATAQDIYSESIRSVLTRWAHDAAAVVVPTWVAASVVTVVALWPAHRLHRLGRDFLGAGVCLVAALPVAPISWNHYWTFVTVPLLVFLGQRPTAPAPVPWPRRRSCWRRTRSPTRRSGASSATTPGTCGWAPGTWC
jgi:hypothetical protein